VEQVESAVLELADRVTAAPSEELVADTRQRRESELAKVDDVADRVEGEIFETYEGVVE
jgi:hypothetical protein